MGRPESIRVRVMSRSLVGRAASSHLHLGLSETVFGPNNSDLSSDASDIVVATLGNGDTKPFSRVDFQVELSV